MHPILAHGPPPSVIAVGIVILLMYPISPIVSIVLGLRHRGHSARRRLGVIFAVLPIVMCVIFGLAMSVRNLTQNIIPAVLWLTPAILGSIGLMINLRKKKDD